MPLVTGQFQNLKYDIEKHRKVLDAALQTQMRQAAREWLRAVIPHVPVYTGMARSSLKPLGRFLRVAVPINPIAVRHDKTPALGEQQQHFEFSNNGYSYTFQWTTDVLHYQLNEFQASVLPLTNPTPWQSTSYGNTAFRRYVDTILPLRIPRAIDYISTSLITLRR